MPPLIVAVGITTVEPLPNVTVAAASPEISIKSLSVGVEITKFRAFDTLDLPKISESVEN